LKIGSKARIQVYLAFGFFEGHRFTIGFFLSLVVGFKSFVGLAGSVALAIFIVVVGRFFHSKQKSVAMRALLAFTTSTQVLFFFLSVAHKLIYTL